MPVAYAAGSAQVLTESCACHQCPTAPTCLQLHAFHDTMNLSSIMFVRQGLNYIDQVSLKCTIPTSVS